MIVIVDYGMGNLSSVAKAFQRLGAKVAISSDRATIASARKLILPGIGHFGTGMENLKERKLIDVLNDRVLKDHIPVLGICLGMQLFTVYGEEGDTKGLGWIKGKTVLFHFGGKRSLHASREAGLGRDDKRRIPHMGWNSMHKKKKSILFENFSKDARFYFVHSYHVVCDDKNDILGETEYGYLFVSMVEKGNIYGTQFHPEKSHGDGLKILKNFMELT